MSRRLAALGLMVLLGGVPELGGAEPDELPVPIVTLDALPPPVPTADLDGPARARAEAVLTRGIFAQRVTGIRYPSREAVYRFLLDHPDFAASVVRALRVGEYRITPLEDGYRGDDNRGATGMIRVLYADDYRRLYHLEGRYERRGLPTTEGQILVLLEFRHEEDERGGTVVEQSLTGHIRIDTPIVGALAQLVSALSRPLVERTVERKVRRFFNTVARVSRWAHDEPEHFAAALDGHPGVENDPTLAAFRSILLAGRPPAWVRAPFRLATEPVRLDGP
ncbi:MAG: hypothetical protein HY002_11905 [Candidatus Rokubacteria bacterium]|nr:hypothetical protein [Candidatus Rokubacteria bacterium]